METVALFRNSDPSLKGKKRDTSEDVIGGRMGRNRVEFTTNWDTSWGRGTYHGGYIDSSVTSRV